MIELNSRQLLNLFPQQDALPEFQFCGVQTDSRKACQGRLYIALRGDRFDGHEFIDSAREQGAVAALVERRVDIDLPQIVVGDARIAMGELARFWRRQMSAKVIAITGSNGKTTVKEMLGTVLSEQAPTLMTKGNLNNDIGVPLTLFELSDEQQFAVVEMGANHAEEIRYLVQIAEPDVVYVNNAREAHVEGFGSLQGVVEAKGEMYRYCKPSAIAVFNADEDACSYWQLTATSRHQYSFSFAGVGDVKAATNSASPVQSVSIESEARKVNFRLQVAGEHNARNACAAITLARACGIDLEQAATALEKFTGVAGRQQIVAGVNDSLLIDDSYNANPDSVSAAISVLTSYPGRHWFAMGDMAELGIDAKDMHRRVAVNAQKSGVEKLFAYGEMSCVAANEFNNHGYCFDDHQTMARFIEKQLSKDVVLLIKGSRSAGMEKLVKLLQQRPSPAAPEVRHAV